MIELDRLNMNKTSNIADPLRYLALGVIADAMRFPLYDMSERPNVFIVNHHPITFSNLLWLLDPMTRDFWFEIARVDWYALRRKLMQTEAFQMLLDKIEKNEVGAEYFEKMLIEFEIPVQKILDERRLQKTKKKKSIPYWRQCGINRRNNGY